LDSLEWGDIEKVINVNLIGTIALTRAVLPLIKERQGRIVTIASLSGEIGNNQQTNYSASKAGLIGFTKALARDVAKYGVSVNAISPGLINSRMVTSIPEHLQERMLSIIPQKRFGSPRSVAELVYFLLTNEENYITGQSIKIDGGLSM
ncbi:MAG: SDR family oxidoreductase, partial [Candidatus Roizmanbacteria bacterium]|nr:SDR family oxidoreductase [Candidatus Roizmanbacteria bacterium]